MHTQILKTCPSALQAGVARGLKTHSRILLLAVLLLCAFTVLPANAAQQVEIYNLSLRFQSATSTQGAVTRRLDFTTAGQSSPANGELALAGGDNNFTHTGFIFVTDPALGRTNYHAISLNIPTHDNDADGMFDILEQAAVSADVTAGVYMDGSQQRAIRATWNKAAGAHTGTCAIELAGVGTFNAMFENIHYSGTYDATKSGPSLTGPLVTRRNGVTTSTLSGPLNLEILSPSLLAWGNGQWVTETGASISYEGSHLDLFGKDEYSAFFVAADGILTTATPDYQTWLLVLPNIPDANQNGTPDLIEDRAGPAGVRLTLVKNGNALSLIVTGAAGRTFDLETRTTLSPATPWTKVATHTFTTDSDTIPLTLPSATAFWRLKQ